MKRWILLALLFAAPVDAASLSFTMTSPSSNNTGTCAVPVLIAATDSVTVRWTALGPGLVVMDSVRVLRGTPIAKTYTATSGSLYVVTVTVARKSTTSGLWLLSCPVAKNYLVADSVPPDTATVVCPGCP